MFVLLARCGQMRVKTRVCLRNQPFVKAPLICAALVATDQQNRLPYRIEGKATRHTSPAQLKRNSFMLACLDPFNVSTVGRPKPGPKSRSSRA